MINEVSNVVPVAVSTRPSATEENRSAAPSDSGKQVPPPGQVQPESESKKASPSRDELDKAVEKLSQHAQNLGRELQFEIDDDSGKTVVKVVDPETDEVVRQIPSEEAVERARSNDDSAMNIVDDMA